MLGEKRFFLPSLRSVPWKLNDLTHRSLLNAYCFYYFCPTEIELLFDICNLISEGAVAQFRRVQNLRFYRRDENPRSWNKIEDFDNFGIGRAQD